MHKIRGAIIAWNKIGASFEVDLPGYG